MIATPQQCENCRDLVSHIFSKNFYFFFSARVNFSFFHTVLCYDIHIHTVEITERFTNKWKPWIHRCVTMHEVVKTESYVLLTFFFGQRFRESNIFTKEITKYQIRAVDLAKYFFGKSKLFILPHCDNNVVSFLHCALLHIYILLNSFANFTNNLGMWVIFIFQLWIMVRVHMTRLLNHILHVAI